MLPVSAKSGGSTQSPSSDPLIFPGMIIVRSEDAVKVLNTDAQVVLYRD